MTSILGIHLVLLGPYRLGQPQVAWLNDEEDGVLTIGLGLLLALGELTTSSATRVLYSCLCLPAASNHNSWLRPSMAHRLLHGPRELTWLTGVPDSFPILGPVIVGVLRGGPSVGQGTLNRFFAAHVLVLQAIAGSRNGSCSRVSPLAGMLVFHVFVNWLLPPVCSQFAICGC